jgi:hypothetical protein
VNKIIILCALVLAAGTLREASAQPPDRRGRKDQIDRVERLKQMRLIEELNLGEDEAVRFMARRKEHEDRMKEMADERNDILDSLQTLVDSTAGVNAIDNAVSRVLAQDQKMFDERKRYQEEMRKILPGDKFARFLVFERKWQMQVRDAMGRTMRKRSGKFDE